MKRSTNKVFFFSNYKLQCYFFWGRIKKGDRIQPEDISYTHKTRYMLPIRSINQNWRFFQCSLAESALSIRFHRTRAVSWPASRARASCGKIPVTTGPTAGESNQDGSGQHIVVIRLIKSALTVARERYNWVQLCILSVSPHKLCNLQQADQPRTPDIAHAHTSACQTDVAFIWRQWSWELEWVIQSVGLDLSSATVRINLVCLTAEK